MAYLLPGCVSDSPPSSRGVAGYSYITSPAAAAALPRLHPASPAASPSGLRKNLQGPALPPEARWWTPQEKDLFVQSGGRFNPSEMARKRRISTVPPSRSWGPTSSHVEVRGRVSIVAPTTASRSRHHPGLWASFLAQEWADKELVVVETYFDEPSEFLVRKAKEDSRLVHVAIKVPQGGDLSVGLKRNMTLFLSSGAYVANFDDDDLYAPNYLQHMVGEIERRGLQAVTLSSWYNYIECRSMCVVSDPLNDDTWTDASARDEAVYGYGFSYVHVRAPGLLNPYPNVRFAEDAPFLLRFRQLFGHEKAGLVHDDQGLVLHMIHRTNSTAGDIESLAREVGVDELASLAVSQLPEVASFVGAARWLHAVLPFSMLRLAYLHLSWAVPSGSRDACCC